MSMAFDPDKIAQALFAGESVGGHSRRPGSRTRKAPRLILLECAPPMLEAAKKAGFSRVSFELDVAPGMRFLITAEADKHTAAPGPAPFDTWKSRRGDR